ncbi:MAG: hypothetical protein EXR52_00640 [Dehalococcoidia bacterium]|nr:hypothetical protein [Dehalococcoidia bacterium]
MSANNSAPHVHTGRHFDAIAAEYNDSLAPAVVAHYLKRRNPYWPLLMARVPQDQEATRLIPQHEITEAITEDAALQVDCLYRGWVPDFAPAWSLPVLGVVERILEAIPGVRTFSAHNVIVIRKGPSGQSALSH